MANFDIRYLFTAVDKYSPIGRKIAVVNDKVRRSATNAGRAITTKFNTALAASNVAALRSKTRLADLEKRFEGITFQARRMRNVGLGLSAAITLPFVLGARAATKFASEAQETRSKFATIFRDISAESEMVADNFAKNFGLAGATSRLLISDTGDLLTGFGFTQEGALDLSRQVNELAVDLASFTNFSGGAEGASAALTKALLGERESLKSLGIAITEDLVTKKISTLVSEGVRFASLAEAKAIATLAIAVDQSGNAIGDYARTQNSSANISRRLTEKTKELKETYGRLLLPVQDKINNSLIAMTEKLNALSPGMQRLILVVGGTLAVLGPLLLIIGSIGLALPFLVSGFAAVGVAITLLTGPIGIIIALTAAIMTFLIRSKTVSRNMGGIIFKIVESFQSLGKLTGGILFSIANAFESLGEIIGGALFDTIKSVLNFLAGAFDKIKGFLATIGLIDLPDQEIALRIIPPENIPGLEGTLNAQAAGNLATASPAVATASANATVNGQINVSASPGSQIDSIEQQNPFRGSSGNVGLGVAAQ